MPNGSLTERAAMVIITAPATIPTAANVQTAARKCGFRSAELATKPNAMSNAYRNQIVCGTCQTMTTVGSAERTTRRQFN